MSVEEVFYSVQSEGMLAGVPSVFVRLSGAGRCVWCAEPKARWAPDGELQLGGLLANVRRHWSGHVVVTGGEPLEDPDIERITTALKTIDHHITIETSGSVFREVPCDLMSISVRLPSTPPETKKSKGTLAPSKLEALRELVRRYPYQLKFEVRQPTDIADVKRIVEQADADGHRVMLIPSAASAKEWGEQSVWIFEACRLFYYRYSPRLKLPPAPRRPAPR